jgi:hypothetical protein
MDFIKGIFNGTTTVPMNESNSGEMDMPMNSMPMNSKSMSMNSMPMNSKSMNSKSMNSKSMNSKSMNLRNISPPTSRPPKNSMSRFRTRNGPTMQSLNSQAGGKRSRRSTDSFLKNKYTMAGSRKVGRKGRKGSRKMRRGTRKMRK